MNETAAQRKAREDREATAAREQEQAESTQPAGADDQTPEAKTAGDGQGSDATDSDSKPSTDPAGTDLQTAGQASVTAGSEHPNQNATSYARTEETFAAEQMARGGVTPRPTWPEAVSQDERVENHREMAEQHAKNVTGTSDGVASVLPAVGGTTNMGLTTAEVLSQLDDGAVDGKGRLAGTYLDDLQAEEAQRRRDRIENMGVSSEARAAAARVRELAGSPVTPAADADKPLGEQGLVDPDKHTSRDGVDPNDPELRTRERVETGSVAGHSGTR